LQVIGQQTGAAHAAAFVSAEGTILAIAEDAGRHNALDKLVGMMAQQGLQPADGFCAITSRASFEMVQKAARVGFPMLCAISAPTALAVRLGQESGITLCAFVRDQRFTCFTHPQRIEGLSRIQAHDIHAVVLAGGEGKRMGGADKGLAVFHGQVLAQRAALRLGDTVGRVSISANRNLEQYETLGFEVFSDELATYEGPLGGVRAALRLCTVPYLAVLPCDAPFFPDDLFTYLAIKLSESKARIAMPLVTQPNGSTFPDPVFMLMHVSVLPELEEYFAAGGRKITTWAGRVGLALVPFTSPDDSLSFMDADTLEALADLANREPEVPPTLRGL
jgi:molybdenum cofactor guanylyltransferase